MLSHRSVLDWELQVAAHAFLFAAGPQSTLNAAMVFDQSVINNWNY